MINSINGGTMSRVKLQDASNVARRTWRTLRI